MITVIIEGIKGLQNTVRSLYSNSYGKFKLLVEDENSITKDMGDKIVSSGVDNLFWVIPSGVLVLTASWDVRMELCRQEAENSILGQTGADLQEIYNNKEALFVRKVSEPYCLFPSGQPQYKATNVFENIGKWEGSQFAVRLLTVTEA